MTFGYLIVLRVLVFFKPAAGADRPALPKIAVVIPSLNEEACILEKIRNVYRSDYPRELIQVIVVDGGSHDRTVELVQEEISNGQKVKLICLKGCNGKVAQVNHILTNPVEDIIVFTDADSRLAPSCIRELVTFLMADPETVLIGANIKPMTGLFEERIHWMLLNYFWWLEGEVFSSAGISGVCYAVDRRLFFTIAEDAVAEDIHLGLNISARGHRVRICRRALAYELRVPQNPREFIRYRRRRGASYINELVNRPQHPNPPQKWKIVRLIRLIQFKWAFWIGAAAGISGILLFLTPYWPALLISSGIFFLSLFLLVHLLANRESGKPSFVPFSGAVFRFAGLFFISLISVQRKPVLMGPLGGKNVEYD